MTDKEAYCKCLYYSSNALARIMTRLAEEEFSAVDLSPSHAFIVMTVNRNPGIPAGELAGIMMLTPSTVTRLVDKLESRRLVRKHSEGRSALIYPTPASVAINDAVKEAWFRLYTRIKEILGEEPSRRLTENIYDAAMKLDSK